MSPYYAIVKDSFREALSSRVLWVVLLLITVVLAGLAPFHWRETIGAAFFPTDIRNARSLAAALKKGANDDASEREQHVWKAIDESTHIRIVEMLNGSRRGAFRARETLARELNQLLEQEDFFVAELWADATLDDRAQPLIAKTNLSEDERRQLNRLALEAALPGQLLPCPDEVVVFRYAKWDLEFLDSFPKRIARTTLDTVLLVVMAFIVDFFGIFAGILVTAPIIPNMFEGGTLYVLLSKPVARPLVFVSKFIGGCSFVLINAAYLIVGLWLLLTIQFGMSKPAILWSIPLFVFSFAIFYAVSALAGLLWRNTVMSIVATVIFWFLCTTVGSTKEALQQFVVAPQRLTALHPFGDELFAVRKNGQMVHWNRTTSSLEETFLAETAPQGRPMMMARNNLVDVVWDAEAERIVALHREWSRRTILAASRDGDFAQETVGAAPRGAIALFWHDTVPIAVADGGVYRVATVPPEEDAPPEINLFGFKIPTPPAKKLHERMGAPFNQPLAPDARAAYDSAREHIYVYASAELRRLGATAEGFEEAWRVPFKFGNLVDLTAASGRLAVVSTEEETSRLQILDADSQQVEFEHVLRTDVGVRELALSVDGRFAGVLYEDDRLALFEAGAELPEVADQGEITAITFQDGQLLVGHSRDRITRYTLPEVKAVEPIRPRLPWINKLYHYLVVPLHFVFPKPSELQNTMHYAITGKDTIDAPQMGPGPPQTIKIDPWQPILSNSLFIGAMLLLGCVYISRQDF